MCGRYILKAPFSELVRLYKLTNSVNLAPHYNIAPTQDVPVVRSDPGGNGRMLALLRWGLVPYWATDRKMGVSLINAKAETVAEKPAFREAFAKRRCIIPADGFYEWKKLDAKTKQPYVIVMKDRSVFGFAGLWERWKDRSSGETIQSCTIITTEPNEVCAPLHNRMPVILSPENYARWLGEEPTEPPHLMMMLKPFPAPAMEAYPVSVRVGNVKHDDAALIKPASLSSP